MNWHELEKEAMNLLLAGDDPVLAVLRHQYRQSSIVFVELTGTGAYVNYAVLETASKSLPKEKFCFGDVQAQTDTLEAGMGVLLWVEKGVLSFLEIYTYEEPWTEGPEPFSVSYVDGERSLAKLQAAWL